MCSRPLELATFADSGSEAEVAASRDWSGLSSWKSKPMLWKCERVCDEVLEDHSLSMVPAMGVPWRDLAQEWRDVDKVMVEAIPRILAQAGWKIYRMKDGA